MAGYPPFVQGSGSATTGQALTVYGGGWSSEPLLVDGVEGDTSTGHDTASPWFFCLYDLGSPQKIQGYEFQIPSSTGVIWYLFGSVNGENWDLLDSDTSAQDVWSVTKSLSPAKAYQYYELQVVVQTGSPFAFVTDYRLYAPGGAELYSAGSSVSVAVPELSGFPYTNDGTPGNALAWV